MAPVDCIGLVVESVVDEFRDEPTIGSVMLSRTVAVHRPDSHRLRAELLRGVEAHQLPSPLRDGIIVELLDGNAVHHALCHGAVMVPINLGATEEDEPELVPLLKSDHVLRSDCVRLPQVLVKVLTVPTAVFGSEVVHIV